MPCPQWAARPWRGQTMHGRETLFNEALLLPATWPNHVVCFPFWFSHTAGATPLNRVICLFQAQFRQQAIQCFVVQVDLAGDLFDGLQELRRVGCSLIGLGNRRAAEQVLQGVVDWRGMERGARVEEAQAAYDRAGADRWRAGRAGCRYGWNYRGAGCRGARSTTVGANGPVGFAITTVPLATFCPSTNKSTVVPLRRTTT
jgi:hypothetical protein